MKIHELNITSQKDKKRVGRGIGSGYGKTAGRGTKGQNARTGGGVRPGFEGGQNPLAKRLPKKRGFAPLNSLTFQVINISKLEQFKDNSKIDAAVLENLGLVKKADLPIKLLGFGGLTKKLSIRLQAASSSATKAVIAAGGSIEIVSSPVRRSKPKVDRT